jgi:hypothetical protein
VTAHAAPPVQMVRQSPLHLTLQFDESVQLTRPSPPTCSLQVLETHVATDAASSLKSQLELAVHDTRLASPPMPLHSEETQVTVSAPVVLLLHFESLVQLSAQSSSPHSVVQSAPPTHTQVESLHMHPAPGHVGADPSPPQPTPSPSTIKIRQVDPKRMGLILRLVSGRIGRTSHRDPLFASFEHLAVKPVM